MLETQKTYNASPTVELNYGETRLKSHPFPNPNGVFQKIRNLTPYPADEKGINHPYSRRAGS